MLDLDSMNPRQLEAVRCTEGPLLVLAGAGSGKTRVITTRIGYLLLHRQVPPENILAVTFTNKAAREMQERTTALVGSSRCQGLILSTFHSLGVRILRREIGLLGYKRNFAIYSSSDQLGLLRQALRDVSTGNGRKVDPEAVLAKISAAKNGLLRPGEYRPLPGDEWGTVAAEVYPRYQKLLKACNALDFDDIIMLTVRLLQEFPDALERWQEQFRYIMVDEYQDTNPSQYLFVSLLADRYRNLCVVGDDDQSIYGWRGADVGKILAFENDYTGCRLVKLEQNYRSTGTILAAANSVIRNNPKRKEKTLWTSSGMGPQIDLLVCGDDEEEATSVVERIQLETLRQKLKLSDFAILYRTNGQSRAFEEQLRMADIPYVLIGGMQFFERKEVKDSLCYLRAISNPLDEQALLRIINFPRRGIGDSTVLRINQWSQEQEIPLVDALARVGEIEGVSPAARERVAAFHELLTGEVAEFRRRGRLAERVAELFKRLGIEEELFRTIEDPKTARRRAENVGEIVNSLAAWESRTLNPTLGGFLEKVSLMDDDRFGKEKKKTDQEAVTLMSLHSSKGLEFPFVFLVGLEEDILPHKRSIYEDFSVDEERRLCYVGITRARRQLVITRCTARKRYGKLEERVPSRFLDEIPAELLKVHGGGETAVSPEEASRLAEDAFAKLKSIFG